MEEEAKNNETMESAAESKPAPVLHVAPGPHLQDTNITTRRMMVDVLIGLAPVVVAASIIFRQYAWQQLGLCVGTCCLTEAICSAIRRKPIPILDFSAVITGVILALSLPWNMPVFVPIIGSAVAIVVGKVIFGGLGQNIFNPAMVGRAFVMLSFAGAVGAPAYVQHLDKMPWLESVHAAPSQTLIAANADDHIDATSNATPMTAWKESNRSTMLSALFLGNTIGSLGETSALACLIGGVFLCLRKTASWQIPTGMLIAVAVIAGIANLCDSGAAWTLLHELLGGAVLFGAFFIATDPVTSPITPKGKFIFGLGVGVFVMIIRLLSVYPEGVMFAVLLMNAVTPLINRWTVPKPLGAK
ncbi:MAG: RnfABCDGE type electron transport complex subunit D [Phycisphaerae bacterium]|nr:RnfABCDGE type electron transport complex subunit D [Phycisphaerae bacterium]